MARRTRGFSLIEVLVAVVILSVGLLALASLQSHLVRGSSASRSQSIATGIAQQTMERLRGFTTKTGGSGSYASIATSVSPTSVTSFNGQSLANTYSVSTSVQRYRFNSDPNGDGDTSDGAFVSVVNDSSVGVSTIPEFKRVTVSVSWTNESGDSNSVAVSDVISSVSPGDTAAVVKAPSTGHQGPKVYIDKSKFEAGVIPIAVSSTNSAASSNPKPEVFNQTGRVTTRFNVQTYVDSSTSNIVLLQKRIDFALTSCTCETTSDVSTSDDPAYEPTYWDGEKYVAPKAVADRKIGVEPNDNGKPNQDPVLCPICCRDHHDSATADVKYDAFRNSTEYGTDDDHKHYDTDNSNSALLTTPVTSGDYYEVCRFVRVDGFNRVATDARLENHITLKAQNVAATSTAGENRLIDSSTQSRYVAFAKDYISAFITAWKADDTYPVPAIPDLLYASDGKAASSIATTYSDIINPSFTDITTLAPSGKAYLASRALYVDYLGESAKKALNCIGNTTDRECTTFSSRTIYEVLPFVAVNLTFLDQWVESATPIAVTSAPIPVGTSYDPYVIGYNFDRGTVTAKSSGNALANARTRAGNAGLTDSLSVLTAYPRDVTYPQFPDAASPPGAAYPGSATTLQPGASYPGNMATRVDGHPYTISGTTTPPPTFTVNVADKTTWSPKSADTLAEANINVSVVSPSVSTPNCSHKASTTIYTCDSTSTDTTVVVRFANYNTQVACSPKGKTTCPNPPAINDFKICSLGGVPADVTVSSPFSVTNSGQVGEYTDVTLTLTPSGSSTVATILSALSITANFYQESATCP